MNGWSHHGDQEAAFVKSARSGRLHHAWLLTGPKGVGKASFAQRAARFLLTDCDNDGAADAALTLMCSDSHKAAALIDAGTHPDYFRIQREVPADKKGAKSSDTAAEEAAAKAITIDQIRTLMGRTRLRPSDSRWRCIIIDSVDDLERSGANALLKTLEEPPDNTIFFLVSHAPGRLLPTIRSRCRILRFAAVPDEQIIAFLQSTMPGSSSADHQLIATFSAGSYDLAGSFSALRIDEVAALLTAMAEHGDPAGARRTELAKAVGGSANRQRLIATLGVAQDIALEFAAKAAGTDDNALLLHDRVCDIARYAISGAEDGATIGFLIADAFVTFYEQCTSRLLPSR